MKILVTAILLFSLSAAAGEVTKFKPRPAVVDQSGSSYVGILLSEEDFREILQKKINTNAKVAECKVDKEVCKHVQGSYKAYIAQLEAKLTENNSWMDRNRGTIGLLSGLVIGVGTSVALVKAVYTGQ